MSTDVKTAATAASTSVAPGKTNLYDIVLRAAIVLAGWAALGGYPLKSSVTSAADDEQRLGDHALSLFAPLTAHLWALGLAAFTCALLAFVTAKALPSANERLSYGLGSILVVVGLWVTDFWGYSLDTVVWNSVLAVLTGIIGLAVTVVPALAVATLVRRTPRVADHDEEEV